MIRKIIITFLVGTMFLLSGTSVLGLEIESYGLKDYEKLIGKKLTFQEAPEIRTKVAAGELPPVEKRLPEEPLIVKGKEIGQYGGVWHRVHEGPIDLAGFGYLLPEHLVRYSQDFKKIVPNLAKGWKWSKDAKSITFYLRKGLKWSDGAPFTADDFMFWWNDIILNDELTPVKSSFFMVGGELMRMEKIDDYTIKLSFSKPYGVLLARLSDWWAPTLYAPEHYLKQFHPKYTPMEKIKKQMKKEGFTIWIDLFGAKNAYNDNPGTYPTINAWRIVDRVDAPIQTWVRNPYYWKVDTEGNQLPYIDKVQQTLVSGDEALLLKAIAGDIDFQYRRIQGLANYTLVKQNEKKGDYKVVLLINPGAPMPAIYFNFFHKDPVLRKLFRDKRFRIALSVAINREEINEMFWKGIATVANVAPAPSVAEYEEHFAKAYTEYDPEKANKILDEIGLKWDEKHEYRLRPDGKQLRFVIEAFTPWPLNNVETMEMCKEYWKKIGIKSVVKPVDRKLWVARVSACEYEVASYTASLAWLGYSLINTINLFPYSQSAYWAPKWGLWFGTSGKSGEEPPKEIKEIMQLREEMAETTSMEKRISLGKKVLQIHADNLWWLGIVLEPDIGRFGIVKNNLRNFPTPPVSGDLTQYHPAIWFFEK